MNFRTVLILWLLLFAGICFAQTSFKQKLLLNNWEIVNAKFDSTGMICEADFKQVFLHSQWIVTDSLLRYCDLGGSDSWRFDSTGKYIVIYEHRKILNRLKIIHLSKRKMELYEISELGKIHWFFKVPKKRKCIIIKQRPIMPSTDD